MMGLIEARCAEAALDRMEALVLKFTDPGKPERSEPVFSTWRCDPACGAVNYRHWAYCGKCGRGK